VNFKKIDSAINWIISQPKFTKNKDLSNMILAYKLLNLNLDNIKKVHIAGTNGKGSTLAFLANILMANNLKVGAFTSPYLIKFNERIRINNNLISDDDLLAYINYFYEFNESLYQTNNFKLSFFELLTLISLKYFSDKNVDIILMEVGIGGKLDSTNILNYDVSIITSIGYDHMDKLGYSLEEIADEKLAIVKPGGFLLSGVDSFLKTRFINYANKIKAKFKFIKARDIFPYSKNEFFYKDKLYKLSLLGDYQRTNALLADNALRYLYNFDDNQILPYLNTTKWAGRLEELRKDVYIDAAHNIPSIAALLRNIEYLFNDKRVTILFSMLKDKPISDILKMIKDKRHKIYLAGFSDLRFKSLVEFEDDNIKYFENGFEKFKELILKKQENEVLIATGSIHFIGYLKREYLKNNF